jgi:hypothetical protein
MKEVVAFDIGATALPEVLRGDEPVVVRGLISHWPIVASARQGPEAVNEYLQSLYNGAPVPVIRGDPAIRGRFFYRKTCAA